MRRPYEGAGQPADVAVEMAMQLGAGRRQVEPAGSAVDVAVQRLHHPEDEPGQWAAPLRRLEDLEQARAAHAAADAHGDHHVLGAAALAFLQDVAGQARAGHAEGVADGDGAAVDVVLLRVDAQLVAAVEALAGEGLVQLPKVDVVDLQAVAFQEARDGEHRADAHLVGLAAGDRPALEDAHGRQAAALRLPWLP